MENMNRLELEFKISAQNGTYNEFLSELSVIEKTGLMFYMGLLTTGKSNITLSAIEQYYALLLENSIIEDKVEENRKSLEEGKQKLTYIKRRIGNVDSLINVL